MTPNPIHFWPWLGFLLFILLFLALDLGVFHRRARTVRFSEACAWSALWITLSLGFAGLLTCWRGREEAVEFVTGYVIEFSLSLDNIFVIALIFGYFRVPEAARHRLLFWGILGAILMRGTMIGLGAVLIRRFEWILYGLGLFLVFTGLRMLFAGRTGSQPEDNFAIRLGKKLLPASRGGANAQAATQRWGGFRLSPLLLVLLLVETTDLIFAVDSIPAVFAVTTKPYIVFTSNIFAILGLRSLYFVLAGAINYFRYLKTGLSVVLVFTGLKMLLHPRGAQRAWFQADIPTGLSLLVVAGIFLMAIALSVLAAHREKSKR